MTPDRRTFLVSGAAALLAAGRLPAAEPPPRLGVIIHSYGLRQADKSSGFGDPLTFLDYCHRLGAGGIQTSLGARDDAYAERLRKRAAEHGMYVEGSVRLPRDASDVERFAAEMRTAQACGAQVVRTVLLAGRRYEVFDSAAAFHRFAAEGRASLLWAKPVVERLNLRLAVENHKDFEAKTLLNLLKEVGSPNIGVCVDTGNNIALLEEPHEVVEALAPFAFSTHIKDMGVEEAADGFLLAEVPLGQGFLDLPRILTTLRKARPEVRFNLEMMTRDPLRIPCLGEKYWATMDHVPARRLARMLTLVRKHVSKQPLPRVSGLPATERLKREDDNVRLCLRHAREKLGLG